MIYKKVWVTMTDKFMSGWGKAESKINKLVIECPDYEKAELIKKNALQRSEMKYINITSRKPFYNKSYFVSYKMFEEMGGMWIK